MKPDLMDKLRDARDFYALTRGVLALCEPFGPVHAFRLVHNRGASVVACFIELESAKQQPALARALGCRIVAGSVCLEVPVRKDFTSHGSKMVPLPAMPAPIVGQVAPFVAPAPTRAATTSSVNG
jgi:hypothetical protein